MSKSTTAPVIPANAKRVPARTVREWAKANPEAVPAEAAHTVNSRGKMHPTLIAAFRKAKRGKMVYDPTVKAVPTVTLRKGRKTKTVPVAEVRAALGIEAKRGRLSAEALEQAAEALM